MANPLSKEEIEAISKYIVAYREATIAQRKELASFWKSSSLATNAANTVRIEGFTEALDLVGKDGHVVAKVNLTIDTFHEGFVTLKVDLADWILDGIEAAGYQISNRPKPQAKAE